jgi:hypothetical protein
MEVEAINLAIVLSTTLLSIRIHRVQDFMPAGVKSPQLTATI